MGCVLSVASSIRNPRRPEGWDHRNGAQSSNIDNANFGSNHGIFNQNTQNYFFQNQLHEDAPSQIPVPGQGGLQTRTPQIETLCNVPPYLSASPMRSEGQQITGNSRPEPSPFQQAHSYELDTKGYLYPYLNGGYLWRSDPESEEPTSVYDPPQYAAPFYFARKPDDRSLLKRELVSASPRLSAMMDCEDLGVFVLHESIWLQTHGAEFRKQCAAEMVQWPDKTFCDFAIHVYEEDRDRQRVLGKPAYSSVPDPHRLPHPAHNCRDVQAKLRTYVPERFDQLVHDVELEHARRILNAVRTETLIPRERVLIVEQTDYRDIRSHAPTIGMLCEGVQQRNLLPFIKRLTILAWKEGFMWQDEDNRTCSGLATLYQLMIVATSDERDRELYRYLISLRDWEARIVLNAIQLLLDFTVHHSNDSVARMALLHTVNRLAGNSGLYPSVIEHQAVDTTGSQLPLVGEGSFGQVFTVAHEGRVLALKVSRKNLEARTFCKEVTTWCNLSHDNILPFYGVYFDTREGQHTLVSPFMAQGSIRKYLKQRFPRIPGPRLLLVKDIASGLEYIHRMGVIHGDLNGDNILVSDSGRACLADFGCSTVSTDANLHLRLTMAETDMIGRLAYQAPELLKYEDRNARLPLSEKSDVYAFGCVCYEIMTSKLPFYDYHPPSLMMSVVRGKRPTKPGPDHLAFVNLGLTEKLWKLMEYCWLNDPDKRPKAEEIVNQPFLAKLRDKRPAHDASGELTAAQIRQNKVVTSLWVDHHDPDTSSMCSTAT